MLLTSKSLVLFAVGVNKRPKLLPENLKYILTKLSWTNKKGKYIPDENTKYVNEEMFLYFVCNVLREPHTQPLWNMKLTWELADQVWRFQLEAAPWEQCNPARLDHSWHTNLMQADQGRPVVTNMHGEHSVNEVCGKIHSNLKILLKSKLVLS